MYQSTLHNNIIIFIKTRQVLFLNFFLLVLLVLYGTIWKKLQKKEMEEAEGILKGKKRK